MTAPITKNRSKLLAFNLYKNGDNRNFSEADRHS